MILPVRLSAASTPENNESVSVVATVDTHVPYLCITPALAAELHLQQTDTRLVTDADGNSCLCPYMGPVMVEARGVKSHMGAVVCGTEVVLGRGALASLGLVADERHGKVYTDGKQVQLQSLRA